jgi:hypothetical protein
VAGFGDVLLAGARWSREGVKVEIVGHQPDAPVTVQNGGR